MSIWDLTLHRNTRAGYRKEYAFTHILSKSASNRAYHQISHCKGYAPTPLLDLPGAALRAGVHSVLYKDEASRFGLGSFKALGGAYAVGILLQQLLAQRLQRNVEMGELVGGAYVEYTREITVACASDGNHGRSVAAGASHFGSGCTVFLHQGVSRGREQAILDLGASVMRVSGRYDDSVRAAKETSLLNGWSLVADTSEDPTDPIPALVMQGYTTLVVEILDQVRASNGDLPTHVFLQGGVGGLAAAVVSYLWEMLGWAQKPIFVIVEPRRADCLYQTAMKGSPTSATGDLDTIMAGLSCGEVSRIAWPVLEAGAEFFMRIEDAAAVESMRLLHQGVLGNGSIIAGESGAAGVAGLLAAANHLRGESLGRLGLDENSIVLLIGTEGATDLELFTKLIEV